MCTCTYAGRKRETFNTIKSEFSPYPSFPVLPDGIIPEPFNLDEELNAIDKQHRRQRRHISSCCNDRYVLFMLDTSGSIKNTTFRNLVANLSNIVPLLCSNTKLAIMSFSDRMYNEFCFNCYTNHYEEATTLQRRIASIPFRGGNTHTGRAINCACNKFLTESCGLPSEDEYKNCPSPIDVVVITDGKSNGHVDVCNAAKCLHDQPLYDVNTFAIGVNNFDQQELDCIVNQNDLNAKSIFYMSDYTELNVLFNKICDYLDPSKSTNVPTCYDTNKVL